MNWTIHKDNFPNIINLIPESEPCNFAHKELTRYLEAILGRTSGIISDKSITMNLTDDESLTDEGYEFSIIDDDFSILTGGEAGMVYAVYEFLRRYAGCLFSGYAPDGEHIPKLNKIVINERKLRRKPELWYRGMQFGERLHEDMIIPRLDWMSKNGYNYVMIKTSAEISQKSEVTVDPETGQKIRIDNNDYLTMKQFKADIYPEIKKRALKVDFNHHNLLYWLPPEKYYTDHPEWYMLKDGKRVAEYSQLCICSSNNEAVNALIENIKSFLKKYPEISIVGVIPEDGYGMCECDSCRNLDKTSNREGKVSRNFRYPEGENRIKTHRYALLVNKVARELRKDFQKIKVGMSAYVDMQWPPRDIMLESNIVPWVAMYWRCAAHPLAPDGCKINRFFYDILSQWKQVHSGRLLVLSYYMGMEAQKSLPYPMEDVIFREWEVLKKLGVDGSTIQSREGSFNTYSLNYLAFARVAWQDQVNIEKLTDAYLLGMFGESGKFLKPIYKGFNRAVRRIEKEGTGISKYFEMDEFDYIEKYFRPNGYTIAYLIEETGPDLIRECINKAKIAAETQREKRQIQNFDAAAQFWIMAAKVYKLYYKAWKAIKCDDPESAEHCKVALAGIEKLKKYGYSLTGDGWIKDLKRWNALEADLKRKINARLQLCQ